MVIISQDRLLVLKTESKLVFKTYFNFQTNLHHILVEYVEDGVKLEYYVADYTNKIECSSVMEKLIKIQLEHGTIINPIDCIDFSTL